MERESTLVKRHHVSVICVRLCWLLALVSLLAFGCTTILPSLQAQADVVRFTQKLEVSSPNMALWSESRRKAYYLLHDTNTPLGVLRVERLQLVGPIYAGTDQETLDRGIGHIEGTTKLEGEGNIGLAAHRDGFFRHLKDIRVGDKITLSTAVGQQQYVVDTINIVAPEDIYVLAPSHTPILTLVTCYPFYFFGNAPKRFIVKARPLRF